MNLREFRKLLVETSGRYDLWNEDGSDNGADRYIQLGQKYLETLVHWDKMEAVQNLTLVGVSNFMLPGVRTIKRVSVRTSTMERFVDLVRINLTQARKYVLDDVTADCAPLFYTIFRSRGQMGEVTEDNFFAITATYQDVLDAQNHNAVGVLLTPLVGSAATVYVEVEGLFRQPALVDDLDENYWTNEWHNLLLYAAMREMEVVHRNTQGVKDWDGAIGTLLVQQEMDYVMDECGPINAMLG